MTDVLLLLALQALPGEKDAEAAVRDMRAAFAGATPEKRVEAIREALRTPHERVIRAVGDVFDSASEGETVRIGAAAALGDLDHPASVDVLLRALAVIDGRVGKRRLRALAAQPDPHPLVRALLGLRCEVEGIPIDALSNRGHR